MSDSPYALGIGVGTKNRDGDWLEVFYPSPLLHPSAALAEALAEHTGGSAVSALTSDDLLKVAALCAEAGKAELAGHCEAMADSDRPAVMVLLQADEAPGSVPEAYLKLHGHGRTTWKSRAHVVGIAAMAMRRVVINLARQRDRLRRQGSDAGDLPDPEGARATPERTALAVDAALVRLARLDPRKAQLVELRFFGGLSLAQAANVQGVSLATAKRDWAFARTWLLREVTRG